MPESPKSQIEILQSYEVARVFTEGYRGGVSEADGEQYRGVMESFLV